MEGTGGVVGSAAQVRLAQLGRRRLVAALSALAGLLLAGASLLPVAPASAAFPGLNGQIAFASSMGGNLDIYTVNPDGSDLAQVTTSPAVDGEPNWNLLGTRLAFTSNREGDYDIYLMNADGSEQANLTRSPGEDHDPSWSPDGTRIAFSSTRGDDTGYIHELYLMNVITGTVTQLTTDGCNSASPDHPCTGVYSNVNSEQPVWSPSGHQIAFIKDQGTSQSLYVMNADGSGQRLVAGTGHVDAPDWSPDGRRLAFSDHSDGVSVVDADGSNLTLLPGTGGGCTPPQQGNCFLLGQPAWSPDGIRLVAVSLVARTKPAGLYTLRSDGTGQALLIADGTIRDGRPNWQASRTLLAVSSSSSSSTTTSTSTTSTTLAPTTTSIVVPTTSTTTPTGQSEACVELARLWPSLEGPMGLQLRQALASAMNCEVP